jgi:N-acetylglucosamine-6-phosphate deacetylase
MTELAVVGGAVVHRDRVEAADVVVRDGTIVGVGPSVAIPEGAEILPADGLLVSPGFVDLQVNGAHGVDVTEEPERLWEVAAVLPRYGVCAFLPTVVTSPPDALRRAMAALAHRPDGFVGAEPLGLHFEGPMLNPERRGAHEDRFLRAPDTEVIEGWTRTEGVALVTLAPELPGAGRVIAQLVANGVVVAAGHTAATVDEMDDAIDAGVSYVTHLFNAMAPFGHRQPGPVGAALTDARVTAGLIADGIHVHPTAVAVAWRVLGPERLNLVSDAVAALGRPHGAVRLGSQAVVLDDSGVRLPDGTLAGSALSLDEAVRNLVAYTGCAAHEAIATVTSTPARVLGLSRAGAVAPGHRADLTLLTPDLLVAGTIVAGREVHRSEQVVPWKS